MPHTRRLCRLQRPHMGLVINAPRVLRRTGARGHARDHRIKTSTCKRRLGPNFWIGRIPPHNLDPGQAFWRRRIGLQMLITSARPEQTHHLVTPLNQCPRGGHADRARRPQQKHALRGMDFLTHQRVVNGPWRMGGRTPFRARSFIDGHAVNSQQGQKVIAFESCRCASSCQQASSKNQTIMTKLCPSSPRSSSTKPQHGREHQAPTSGFREMQGP